jgi:transposase
MKDSEFFAQALGLREPWRVKEVKLDMKACKVEVILECDGKVWADPESHQRLHVHGYENRQWRHLDTMQFETVLVAEVPRVKYPDGHTELVAVPWAKPHGRFTLMFEGWALRVLLAASHVSAACELLRLSWDTAQAIMERGVQRGLARRSLEGMERVGIDEKSFRRGQDYVSVLTDLDKGRVIEVEPGRDQQSAGRLLESVPPQWREAIKAVAMDMSGGFAAAVREKLPQADIVYDRFHVSKLFNEALDQVRRKENKDLLARGDDTLKGTRMEWLFNPRNLSDSRVERLAELASLNLKTARAWRHKENFEGFWSMPSYWAGEGYLKAWYRSAIRSQLDPIKRCARTVLKHAEGLLNYFIHHISNAVTEGLNSKIQSIKAAARGLRNPDNYRIRILFFCGKLDMHLDPMP